MDYKPICIDDPLNAIYTSMKYDDGEIFFVFAKIKGTEIKGTLPIFAKKASDFSGKGTYIIKKIPLKNTSIPSVFEVVNFRKDPPIDFQKMGIVDLALLKVPFGVLH